MGENLQQTYR